MGGKLFNTSRKNTIKHLKIQEELIPILSNVLNTKIKPVKFYSNKKDHGDLDLICLDNQQDNYPIIKQLYDTCNKNGNVISFVHDSYQVDLIFQPQSNWNICNYFYDFDPLGNLTGKIAHRFNLKFGFAGLTYPYRGNRNTIVENIPISKNPEKIFNFLGYDFNEYLNGFNDINDIFKYVQKSKYFDEKIFYFENLNSIDKKRNAKRKTYNEFITYINSNKQLNDKIYIDKLNVIELINKEFPESNLIERINYLNTQNDINNQIKNKFNGDLIIEWTNNTIIEKELGDLIYNYKQNISNFDEYILNTNENEIKNNFLKFLDLYKKDITFVEK